MDGLLIAKNEALADIDYFIHEIEENNLDKKFISKFEKGKSLVIASTTIRSINDYLTMLSNIFVKVS